MKESLKSKLLTPICALLVLLSGAASADPIPPGTNDLADRYAAGCEFSAAALAIVLGGKAAAGAKAADRIAFALGAHVANSATDSTVPESVRAMCRIWAETQARTELTCTLSPLCGMTFDYERQLIRDFERCSLSVNCNRLDPVLLMGQSASQRELFFTLNGLSPFDAAQVGEYSEYASYVDSTSVKQNAYSGFFGAGGQLAQLDQSIVAGGGF